MGEKEQEGGEKEEGEHEMGKDPTPQQPREGAFLQSFLLDTGTDSSPKVRRRSGRRRRRRSRRIGEKGKSGQYRTIETGTRIR